MNFSKYTHIVKVDNEMYALYNSLLIDIVFLNKSELDRLKQELANRIESWSEQLEYLYKHFYLIDNENQDDEIYNNAVNKIPSPQIKNTYIIISEKCNFNCEYCFLKDAVYKNPNTKIMDNITIRDTVTFLQQIYEAQKNNKDNDQIITFYGGEPLLNFDGIKYFINEVKKTIKDKYWPKVQYSIVTNGSLIKKETIDFFKENNIALGISLDGDRISNSKRNFKNGTQSFDKILSGIKLCSDNNLQFTLSVTITEEILRRRNEILDFLISLRPESLSFNILMPEKGIDKSEKYYKDATQFMIQSFEQLKKINIVEDRIMRKVHAFTNKNLYLYDCSAAGGNQLVITPQGKVGLCHGYLNTMKYFPTTISEKPIFSPQKNAIYQLWNKRTPLLMDQCQDCVCLGICGGGCPYVAEYTNGSIFSLDNRFCIHSKTVLQWLIKSSYEICIAK